MNSITRSAYKGAISGRLGASGFTRGPQQNAREGERAKASRKSGATRSAGSGASATGFGQPARPSERGGIMRHVPGNPNTITDWITAIGTAGAAVGTVSAVAVALWQSRPERPDLMLECISETVFDGSKPTAAYLKVRVTNRGSRPANLQYSPSFVAERRHNELRFAVGVAPDAARSAHLPRLLQDGESADFRYDHCDLISRAHEPEEALLMYASVMDQFGARFYVPMPGVKMKKRWFKREPRFEHSGVLFRGGPLAKYAPTPPDESASEPPTDASGSSPITDE